MTRLPDWERRLAAYLTQSANKPHRYGKHDCVIFPLGAVKAVTGRDLLRGHRGKWSSAKTGKAYLAKLGFGSSAEGIASLLPEKPVTRAQRGDLVADENGVPGVCIGGDAVFVGLEDGREGLVRKPRRLWSRAWGV